MRPFKLLKSHKTMVGTTGLLWKRQWQSGYCNQRAHLAKALEDGAAPIRRLNPPGVADDLPHVEVAREREGRGGIKPEGVAPEERGVKRVFLRAGSDARCERARHTQYPSTAADANGTPARPQTQTACRHLCSGGRGTWWRTRSFLFWVSSRVASTTRHSLRLRCVRARRAVPSAVVTACTCGRVPPPSGGGRERAGGGSGGTVGCQPASLEMRTKRGRGEGRGAAWRSSSPRCRATPRCSPCRQTARRAPCRSSPRDPVQEQSREKDREKEREMGCVRGGG